MRKHTYVTLEFMAKQLGVSSVTISKALRGHPDISNDMTKRVHQLADKLGYTPNIIARSLSSRRSSMIGLVVPKIAHAFFSAVIEGVYDAAFANNYETILTVSMENPDRELKHLQSLVSMRVDGIIISVSQKTRDIKRFKWIQKMGVPLVFVDRTPEPPPPNFSCVLSNDRDGAYQAVKHAISIGYRKMGFVGGHTKINIGKNRLEGFKDALKEENIPINREWIVTGGFGRDDGYAGLKHLHQNGKLPEFILAATYPVALGIYEAAKDLGIRIPEDIDIICYGDSDVARFLSPPISAVRQPTRELGEKAVQILLKSIMEPEIIHEHHVILPAQLVIRETCTVRTKRLKERAIQKEAVVTAGSANF
jgi:LacI family transcriptional regulator